MIRPHFGSSEPGDLRMIRTFPGSSGPCAQNLSGYVRMIRSYLGSSGPDSFSIYRPTAGCPNPLFLFPPPQPFFSPKSSTRRSRFWTKDLLSSLASLILHVSEDPNPSGTPSIRAGISKVFHSKSPRPDLSM